MTDDIDDLLNEVESKFCTNGTDKKLPGKQTQSTRLPGMSKASNLKKKDDIDDLINEIFDDDDDVGIKGKNVVASQNKKQSFVSQNVKNDQSSQQTKCFQVFLGGSSCAQGLGTTVNQRACDNLRCTDCDFRVSSFDNVQWHSSTDYLFLRNNMPDLHRLKPKLTSKKGSRAYACQCKWKSVRDFVNLQKESDLKWVCGKH